MAIYISVVSHGHAELINKLNCLSALCTDFQVVLKSNKVGDQFDELKLNNNFHWIDESFGCGFGHNNNIVFEYCKSILNMTNNDYFIVLNPDVVINNIEVNNLIRLMEKEGTLFAAINLFKDSQKNNFDNSVRTFPSFNQFVASFLGLGNSSIIDKRKITKPCAVDWASGSFLAFKANYYAQLGGFDENYFMYCEDIDICYRSHQMDVPVIFYPNISAIHLAKHANRKILSKHFVWHITSVGRFLLTKAGMTKPRTSVSSMSPNKRF